jgi:tetratricopeptide (TPR) repeat protein
MMGYAQRSLGRLGEAEKLFHDVIRITPNYTQAYISLADLLSAQARGDEAESILRQAIKIMPASVPAHINLGSLLFERGKGAESLAESREALRLEPNNPTALNNVGYYMVERGENLEEALKMVQRAVDFAPNVPGFRDSLGWAYFKLGRLEEAERYLAGAARETASPLIHEHLGDVYDKRGKREMAMAEWQQALADLQKIQIQPDEHGQLARLKSKLSGDIKK